MHPLESRLYLTHCLVCGTLLGALLSQALLYGAGAGAFAAYLWGYLATYALGVTGVAAFYVCLTHAAVGAFAGALLGARRVAPPPLVEAPPIN